MGFLFQRKSEDEEPADCGQLVLEAQQGNGVAREHLIKSYTPFVLKVISKMCGKYVRMGEDDEASIGLIAFNEAIDCFDTSKKISFLSFAETVIRRRLIDYFRKESSFGKKVVPLSSFEQHDEENFEGILYHIESKESVRVFAEKNEAAERKEEIILFTKILKEFGISFQELVSASPKHEDARLRAMEVARIIAEDSTLRRHVVSKKELPLKLLEKKVEISRKTLERQRKYIIAITLVLINEFDYLKQYIAKSF